jgi:pimeloyl-ACP methyl ester carboxylesterase
VTRAGASARGATGGWSNAPVGGNLRTTHSVLLLSIGMGLFGWVYERTAHLGKEIADSGHAAVYLRQLLRGNRGRTQTGPDASAHFPDAGPPVLLIHGYLATRGSLHLLERRLRERRHVVLSYRIPRLNVGDIRDSAALIARKVESLVAQTGVPAVDIVGHSMGGLVGLYYVKRLGGRRRVRRLIMLGTPAAGTWSALLGLVTAPFGVASLQLLPSSPFLRELNETPIPAGVDVVSVGGERDYFAPLSSTVLEGVRHVALPTSHSGLLVDAAVADTLVDLLRVA